MAAQGSAEQLLCHDTREAKSRRLDGSDSIAYSRRALMLPPVVGARRTYVNSLRHQLFGDPNRSTTATTDLRALS